MSIEEAYLAAHRGHAPPWEWGYTEECAQCMDNRAAMLAVLDEAQWHLTAQDVAATRAKIAALGAPQEVPDATA